MSDTKPAAHQPSEGVKHDADKARYDLIPAYPLDELVKVYTFGATKYADHNWRKGLAWSRVFAAIMRHLWAFWRGEDNDPETGLPHPVHAAWGCFTLIEYMRFNTEGDDRYRAQVEVYETSCLMCNGTLTRREGQPWKHVRNNHFVCFLGEEFSTTAVPACEGRP